MRKYSILVLYILLCAVSIHGQVPTKAKPIFIKGQISSDSENENNSPDPQFVSTNPIRNLNSLPAGSQRLSDIPNAVQMIKDVVNEIMNKDYSFALLPQHKYMINSCLGLKASAGGFTFRFQLPEVYMNNEKKFVIRFTVAKIDIEAIKVRMRPCPSDGQCHFSSAFELGGVAKDVSLTMTIDPMVVISASTGVCALSFLGDPFLEWKIGALNLKPLQNDLDRVAKEMIEDALNGGVMNMLYNEFIQLVRRILPSYFETCRDLYTDPETLLNMVDDKKEGKESGPWEIIPNQSLKGSTGRLVAQLPAKASMILQIHKSGEPKHFDAWYDSKASNLLPAIYDIKVNNVWLQNVPIQKGKDTRLKLGVLEIPFDGNYSVKMDDGTEVIKVSGNEKRMLVLPEGKYKVVVASGEQQVKIKDGAVTTF